MPNALHDALCVLSQMAGETRTVLGAGCSECLMAEAVTKVANQTAGKKALAMHAFASALRAVPLNRLATIPAAAAARLQTLLNWRP